MTDPDPERERRELDSLARDLDDFFQAEPPAPPPDPSCPPQLPGTDYRLVRLLGSGGMGAVWEAEQISLGRRVAVKVLCVETRDVAAWRERFVRESRIVAQLHHPCVVKVFAAGACGETFWYAMELVDGVPLSRYVFPDLRTAVEGVRMAAAALAYAHGCGVVHRDVKPANLLVDAQGRVLVADFGLAAVAGDSPAGASDDGGRDGTRRYMAPERLEKGVCGFAADQYALALTLREIAANFPRPCFHADLAAVLDKALSPDPADRYADMDAFSDDLRRVLAYEPPAARSASLLHRARLWCRRHPRAAVATGLALFCAAGFVSALCAGYVRTEAARRQAARNARLADGALTEVFAHVSSRPPSPGDAELLSVLAPYYGELAGAPGASDAKTFAALMSQGVCAFRSSDYELAEQAFRQLVARRRLASDLNWLAETLRRQGRKEEAEAVARQVVSDYAASADENDRKEVACALEVLGERRHRGNPDRAAAFAIFHALMREHPENPYYRFRTLHVLATDARLAEGTELPKTLKEVAVAMGELADAYPEALDFGQSAVDLVSRLVKRKEVEGAADLALLRRTCERGDALLGRYLSSEHVIVSVTEFRGLFASWLSRHRHVDEARRERVRTETIIELLAGSASLPVPVRGQHAYPGGALPYRMLDCPGGRAGDPVSLVVLLHAKDRCGADNTRPLCMPLLRALVPFVRRQAGRTVVLVPQCPSGRAETWFGADRGAPDALFDGVADLVASTADRLKVPAARVLLVGELEGADAALALAARRPGLAGRVLAAGARPLPAAEAARLAAAVNVCLAEFDSQTKRADMARSLEAVPADAAARPALTLLPGAYRTTVARAVAEDVFFKWLFTGEPAAGK